LFSSKLLASLNNPLFISVIMITAMWPALQMQSISRERERKKEREYSHTLDSLHIQQAYFLKYFLLNVGASCTLVCCVMHEVWQKFTVVYQVHSQNYKKWLLTSSYLSTWKNLAPTGQIFMKFDDFLKVKKMQWNKSNKMQQLRFYSPQWLYSTCFGRQSHPSSGVCMPLQRIKTQLLHLVGLTSLL
jgi:hypothetical protein